MRFAQVGTWSGVIHLGSDDIAVDDDTLGRHPGPVLGDPAQWASPSHPGGAGAEPDPAFGFWWTYVPLRFDDFAVVVIAQEQGDGTRLLNEAVRVFPAARGGPPEQLGWPDFEIRYRPGTRHPESAVLRMRDPERPARHHRDRDARLRRPQLRRRLRR